MSECLCDVLLDRAALPVGRDFWNLVVMTAGVGPEPARQRSATRWAVGTGIALGMFLTVLWIVNVGVVGYESLESSSPGGPSEEMVIGAMLVPQAVAVVFLVFRAARRRALGLGTGIAIGALLAATLWMTPGLTP